MNCLWYATGDGDEKRCRRRGCDNRVETEHPPERCFGECQAAKGDCVKMGEAIRTEQCPTCCGNVKVKVFACSARGECTVSKIIGNIPCCVSCAQFEPPGVEYPP